MPLSSFSTFFRPSISWPLDILNFFFFRFLASLRFRESTVYCKHGFGNISILLAEDNDIEEEITHLFNEGFLFSSLTNNHN